MVEKLNSILYFLNVLIEAFIRTETAFAAGLWTIAFFTVIVFIIRGLIWFCRWVWNALFNIIVLVKDFVTGDLQFGTIATRKLKMWWYDFRNDVVPLLGLIIGLSITALLVLLLGVIMKSIFK